MAKIRPRQVPDVLRELEDESSFLMAKKLDNKVLTRRQEKRCKRLDNFFDWLEKAGFYERLNKLSPYIKKAHLNA